MAKVLLAMSGGVDSSVAAHLLREQNHDVVGVFMRHGAQSPAVCPSNGPSSDGALPIVEASRGHKQGCCSAADAHDARRVADHLGITFYALNMEEEFGQIIDYFVDEYTAGRTPNPCVMCNNWIKFGRLFEYADSIGADYVATGHYARLTHSHTSIPQLRRGQDVAKDQSYVLFGVARELFDRMLLPVGDYHKAQIRGLAHKLGLRVADKRDSQEICFVTSGHHGPFVAARRGPRETAGEIVTTAGQVVGTHDGIERFTVGQRKGLGIAMGEAYFVVRIDADRGRVVIGTRDELARTQLHARQVNWLADRPAGSLRCAAQIRYNSRAVAATVEPLEGERLRVVFDQPCFGVAPGQAVVCYDGDRVLCGGWIE
jgi:tRNA-specific 2-thiouridylase